MSCPFCLSDDLNVFDSHSKCHELMQRIELAHQRHVISRQIQGEMIDRAEAMKVKRLLRQKEPEPTNLAERLALERTCSAQHRKAA